MDRFGFIREELDIKILILFVLNRLPGPVSQEALAELVLVDEGFDYFEFSQCLSELVKTGHVSEKNNGYRVTELGEEHGNTVESSLPYSVRTKAERRARPLIAKMKRDAQILSSHEVLENGGCKVSLSLSDGIGSVIELKLLSSGPEQAELIERNFRADAENIYLEIIRILTEQDEGKIK